MPITAASPQNDTMRVVAGILFAGAAVAVGPNNGMASASLAATSIGLLAKPSEASAAFIDGLTGDSPAMRFGVQLGLGILGGLAVRLSHAHSVCILADGMLLMVANHLTPFKEIIPQAKAFAEVVGKHTGAMAGSIKEAVVPSEPLISLKLSPHLLTP